MTCDPDELMSASRCFACIQNSAAQAIAVLLLCRWAEADIENPAPPCEFSITPGPGGTVILHWQNGDAYTSVEVWHGPLFGPRHLEATLPGNATSFQTPVLAPGDFFIVRGVVGDDVSPFAHGGPC